jgi:hypothetical protein
VDLFDSASLDKVFLKALAVEQKVNLHPQSMNPFPHPTPNNLRHILIFLPSPCDPRITHQPLLLIHLILVVSIFNAIFIRLVHTLVPIFSAIFIRLVHTPLHIVVP